MRLVAAREYKAGLSPAQIENKYSWSEGIVYHWLDYFEERGDDAALVINPDLDDHANSPTSSMNGSWTTFKNHHKSSATTAKRQYLANPVSGDVCLLGV